MQDTLNDHDSTISIGDRPISNLRYPDDIDLIAGSSNELQKLTLSLAKSSFIYGMEISHERSKILINDPDLNKCNSNNLTINMYRKKQEQVKSFKYQGVMLTVNANIKNEIAIRICTATSIMVRLEIICRSREINFKIKFNLFNSLILSTLLYGCETWTLLEESKKRLNAFEYKSHGRILNIT